MTRWYRIARGFAEFGYVATAAFLLVLSVGILNQPGFPLGLGLIRTTGLTGLWVTLLPAIVALGGVLLMRLRVRLGGVLLVIYSGFWALVVASGVPAVWNAKSSFCLNSLGFCITSPWLGRLAALALLGAFLLLGVWSWQWTRGHEWAQEGRS